MPIGYVKRLNARYDGDDAASQYRAALEVNPPQAVAIRYNLALALYKAARPGEAGKELEKVLEAQPDASAAHYALGQALVFRVHHLQCRRSAAHLAVEPQAGRGGFSASWTYISMTPYANVTRKIP